MKTLQLLVILLFVITVFTSACTSPSWDEVYETPHVSNNVNSQGSSALDNDSYAIVTTDSAALRIGPSVDAQVESYVKAGLLLEVVDISEQGDWYCVKNAHYRAFQMHYDSTYWMQRTDLFQTQNDDQVEMEVGLSILESGNWLKGEQYLIKDYVRSKSSLDLETDYYLNAVFNSENDIICSGELSSCAQIYLPSRYFVLEGEESGTDVSSFEEYINRHDELYANGTVKPFFRLDNLDEMKEITETVFLSKHIVSSEGCYPESYYRTEVLRIAHEKYNVNERSFMNSQTIPLDEILKTNDVGAVYFSVLTYVLNISYSDGRSNQICKRLEVTWPMCI